MPAGSEAWAVLVDNQPVKPQRQGNVLLVGLPASTPGSTRTLKLTYRTPVAVRGPDRRRGAARPRAAGPCRGLRPAGRGPAGRSGVAGPSCPAATKSSAAAARVSAELEPPEPPAILNVAKAACGLAALTFSRTEFPSIQSGESPPSGQPPAKSAAKGMDDRSLFVGRPDQRQPVPTAEELPLRTAERTPQYENEAVGRAEKAAAGRAPGGAGVARASGPAWSSTATLGSRGLCAAPNSRRRKRPPPTPSLPRSRTVPPNSNKRRLGPTSSAASSAVP